MGNSKQSNKPIIFVSHAHSDGEFARIIQMEIEKVFADKIEVFCTSSPKAVLPSDDWLEVIEQNLNKAQAVIVIVTPISIQKSWVWFEIGATWLKSREKRKKCRIYPLCVPEIQREQLPSPLNVLQSLSLANPDHLNILFQALIEQYKFGDITLLSEDDIITRIPNYSDITINDLDRDEEVIYSGKYIDCDDEELKEIIDSKVLYRNQTKKILAPMISDREFDIYSGKLIFYQDIDRELELPPGTARRLLSEVAARYGLVPKYEGKYTVRFRGRGSISID